MKVARDPATELASFLICLCLGFTLSFTKILPLFQDMPIELMRHLFAVGFGFGTGVCFFLIYLPIQDLAFRMGQKISFKIDSLDQVKKAKKPTLEENRDEP